VAYRETKLTLQVKYYEKVWRNFGKDRKLTETSSHTFLKFILF